MQKMSLSHRIRSDPNSAKPSLKNDFQVAVHVVILRLGVDLTEFLDGLSSLVVPLQFRCDFDRRCTKGIHDPDAKSAPLPKE